MSYLSSSSSAFPEARCAGQVGYHLETPVVAQLVFLTMDIAEDQVNIRRSYRSRFVK